MIYVILMINLIFKKEEKKGKIKKMIILIMEIKKIIKIKVQTELLTTKRLDAEREEEGDVSRG